MFVALPLQTKIWQCSSPHCTAALDLACCSQATWKDWVRPADEKGPSIHCSYAVQRHMRLVEAVVEESNLPNIQM